MAQCQLYSELTRTISPFGNQFPRWYFAYFILSLPLTIIVSRFGSIIKQNMTEKNREMRRTVTLSEKGKVRRNEKWQKRTICLYGLFLFFPNFFLIFFKLEDNCFIMLYWFLYGFERVTGRKAKGLQTEGKQAASVS